MNFKGYTFLCSQRKIRQMGESQMKRFSRGSRNNTIQKNLEDVSTKKYLKKILNNSIKLSSTLENIKEAAIENGKSSEYIAMNSQEIAEQNIAELEIADKTTIHSQKISEMMKRAAEFSNEVNLSAHNSREVSVDASNAVEKSMESMRKIETRAEDTYIKITNLAEKSEQIGEFISVISGIAKQTNLLALNASIEAARAGEHGKGFSVVAEEVRKLAEQSNAASKEISDIIQEIRGDIHSCAESIKQVTEFVLEGVSVTDEAENSLKLIVDASRKSAKKTEEIDRIMNDTTVSCDDVLAYAKENQDLVQKTAEASKNIAASAQEQNASMEEINSSIQLITQLSEETTQNVASAVMDELMYRKALDARDYFEKDRNRNITKEDIGVLAKTLGVDQVDVTDKKGNIIKSNLDSSIGVNIYKVKMDLEKMDLKKYLFEDKNMYSVGELTTSVQTGKLYKFLTIPGKDGQVYQVALSYDTLLELLEK